jgi:hypothetical protein
MNLVVRYRYKQLRNKYHLIVGRPVSGKYNNHYTIVLRLPNKTNRYNDNLIAKLLVVNYSDYFNTVTDNSNPDIDYVIDTDSFDNSSIFFSSKIECLSAISRLCDYLERRKDELSSGISL